MKHILLTAIASSLIVVAQASLAYPNQDASVSERDLALGEVTANPTSGMSLTVDTGDLYENRAATLIGEEMVSVYVFDRSDRKTVVPNSFAGQR